MLIKTHDTVQAEDGRTWRVRDRYAYSRGEFGYDVILLDERGEPAETLVLESLDDLDKHLSKRPDKRAVRDPGPDRPFVIQLPPAGAPKQRFDLALRSIRAAPDTVFVEMDEYREDIGGILLTDTHQGAFRPDSGVVIAENCHGEVCGGDHVLLAPYGGAEWDGFQAGVYEAEGRVKVYGSASADAEIVEYEDWRENIVGAIEHLESERLRAVGDWVLLRRDPETKEEGGIELPASQRYRNQKATIWSAGYESGYRDGERVMYNGGALMYGLAFERGEYGLEGDPDDYAFIRAGNLYGRIME